LKKSFIISLFLLCKLTIACCQQSYWQQKVDYKIDVALNDESHTLDGFVKIDYYNNSPDTLYFIWFHLWPNAYKNDRTAFSDQLLANGRTDFYFSNSDQRGYINRLDFKADGTTAKTEDHPIHQDIVKIILPKPLAPHSSVKIQTPFHVQLPFNFSRGGHVGQAYQVTQWYPKPAVYDQKGWHPMPYLDQGEFYSEFGNYEVQITLPKNYVVAATGQLQDEEEQNWLKEKADAGVLYETEAPLRKQSMKGKPGSGAINYPPSSTTKKTIRYIQENVHDFAWFADKRFAVKQDTLQLKSGRIISVAAFWPNTPTRNRIWKNSIAFLKKSIYTRSNWLGEYPYNTVTALEAEMGFAGGMEYPTITSISPMNNEQQLEGTIEHEVGHNWNYGILASNERDHPWMDEGINSYYDDRYKRWNNSIDTAKGKESFFAKRIPTNFTGGLFNAMAENKKDQPIETTSEEFSEINYGLVAYYKTGQWMKLLEQELGTAMLDSCMHEFYRLWQFKHPYPGDLKAVIERTSGRDLTKIFALLNQKGKLPTTPFKRKLKLASFFNLRDTDKNRYIFLSPVPGFNVYDKFMIGVALHNYTLPEEPFQFFLTPLYATGSKQLNGVGRFNYHRASDGLFQRVELGLNADRFSMNHSLDTTGKDVYESFFKIVPYVKLYFKSPARSTITRWLDFRSYNISEKRFDNFNYKAGSDSVFLYPTSSKTASRYINQLSFNEENRRALYPYSYQLQLQQGKSFYRVNFTADYFFNYPKGGGITARFFAAKFGYIGNNGLFNTFQYRPKLLGANGTDDYTYSNYFLGRTASTSYAAIPVANGGLAAQQIMIQNTGGLKFRLDPYSVQGQSGDWIAAINLNTTIPAKLFPAKIPLRVYFDAGTYAEAWDKNATQSKFLYVGGLQLSLFKNVLNIYAPIIYSKAFKDYLKTDPEANKFSKKITFSIDVQNLQLKKLFPKFAF
jgi:hypothetical protein